MSEIYLAKHKCIRNNGPAFCTTKISFHRDVESAVASFGLNQKTNDKLRRCRSLWIDEWVKKRNGDSYKIIQCKNKYNSNNVSHIHLKTIIEKINESYNIPMAYYPDIVKFRIKLSSSSSNSKMIEYDRLNTYWSNGGDEQYEVIDDEITYHYTVLDFEYGKSFLLNSYCPDLQSNRYIYLGRPPTS